MIRFIKRLFETSDTIYFSFSRKDKAGRNEDPSSNFLSRPSAPQAYTERESKTVQDVQTEERNQHPDKLYLKRDSTHYGRWIEATVGDEYSEYELLRLDHTRV